MNYTIRYVTDDDRDRIGNDVFDALPVGSYFWEHRALKPGFWIYTRSGLTSRLTVMELELPEADVESFQERHFRWASTTQKIQDAFPELDANQREFFLTGSTPEEWDDSDEEDEEDEEDEDDEGVEVAEPETPKWSFEKVCEMLDMDPGEMRDRSIAIMSGWLERGDSIAVYENRALDSSSGGHKKFVSFGSPAAQLEVPEPPRRLPDIGGSINWRYGLIAVCYGETE